MPDHTPPIAIQETYGPRFQHCWGCGVQNGAGLHLRSYPSADGKQVLCHFTPPEYYTGGVPHNIFGGMIAVLFDCHGTASAAWFAHHNRGLTLTPETIIGRFITARLEIDFKKPLPTGAEVTIIAESEEIGERKGIVRMQMIAQDELRAEARMVAVPIKDTM